MKKIFLSSLTVLALININYLQGQTVTFKQHKVNRGETVTNIAKQHNVFVKDIYKYNPGAENGIKENSFLLIPNIVDNDVKDGPSLNAKPIISKERVFKENLPGNIHIVEKSETLYGISKKYNISIEDLIKLNPYLKKDRLQTGQSIVISESNSNKIDTSSTKIPVDNNTSKKDKSQTEQSIDVSKSDSKKPDTFSTEKTTDHTKDPNLKRVTVKPKETIYGLALEYRTSVKNLYRLNPELEKEGLKIGQTIYVPVYKDIKEKIEVKPVSKSNPVNYRIITVQPKQTLFSLERQYNVTTEQLLELNPELINGLKIGMNLKIPNSKDSFDKSFSYDKSNYINTSKITDLGKTINKNVGTKELVLLFPFNAHKVENDPSSIQEKLKKDALLNMTLDFYSGALIAIDSAKSLGLPLNVKIYDSKESKSSSSIPSLISNNNFANTDVIIGPFFQKNIAKTAELIRDTNIALVSPLSTERTISDTNEILAMPSTSDLRRSLMEYMLSEKGNIIAVVDTKKASTRKFLEREYPDIIILNESYLSKLPNYLKKDRKNFVVLDTKSIQTALNTINPLIKIIDNYNIQLATFDKNEIFDYREMSLDAIVKLKLLYPSVSREIENRDSNHFAKIYKQKNNVYPNKYATRGFDVTMDIIFRLFQPGEFKENLTNYNTQYVENKFNYSNFGNIICNKGVYLFYYDDDLTIKNL